MNHLNDPDLRGIVINAREVSKRKQTEAQLKQSEEKYWSLFNKSPLPMWIVDQKTRHFLLANEAACTIYGYSREDYAQMQLKDLGVSTNLEVPQPIHGTLSFFATHRKNNGELVQVKIESSDVMYDGREARIALAIDMTREQQMHEQLTESNKRLQSASEIANLGYWTRNLKTDIIFWSPELYKIFDVDPLHFELSEANIKLHYPPENRAHFEVDLPKHFNDGSIREEERRIITGKGEERWLLERLNLTLDENGQPSVLEGIVLDITRRKTSEQMVSASNERFKMVMKATVEAIVDWDILTNTVQWGDGFRDLFGYDLRTIDNNMWSRNIHPDDHDRVTGNLIKVLKDKNRELFYEEFRFLKANGDIAFVQHRAIFIRDSNGRAIRSVGAMIDVTESMERLHRIERQNEALKEIAWVQSHIVRAPLANLLGFASLLQMRDISDPVEADLLADLVVSANKLDDVIRGIVRKAERVYKM